MCEKCVRKGRKHKVRKGLLNFLTREAERGFPIPLFYDRPSNFYIEGRLYLWQKAKTNRSHYSRKGRKHNANLLG